MLVDSYNRKIDYLRISLTQNCNFRCLYCMPKVPFEKNNDKEILALEDLFLFVKIVIDEGVRKIRITGGEPLLRKDLSIFIKMINDYNPNIDLALTTNGFLLKQHAKDLKAAGLKKINISLDTLQNDKAKTISGGKEILKEVLEGIDEAIKCGFITKLNTVVLKDINDNELISLLEFAKDKNVAIRFIEFMENTHAYGQLRGINADEILSIIGQKFNIISSRKDPNSPVSLYELDNGYKFGIIDPHSNEFCVSCNRIRLTAEGFLVPCLYFDQALSIKKAIQNKDFETARAVLKEIVQNKPEKNKWDKENNELSNRAFYQTGG